MKIISITAVVCNLLYFAYQSDAQTYNINTVVGNGKQGYTGDGGPAVAAELYKPQGITFDALGNMYIADTYNSVIRKVNTSGIITTVAGNGTIGFSGDGHQATTAELAFPYAVAVDASGNMYIADNGNDRVRKVNTSGIISTIAGYGGAAGYTGNGGPATAAKIAGPWDITLDAAGNIYIAEGTNNVVRVINTGGIINVFAGNGNGFFAGDGGPDNMASIDQPFGLGMANGGVLYITDHFDERIRKSNAGDTMSSVAGNGTSGYSGDGFPATGYALKAPNGVAADSAGNIYIGDTGNERIRKVDNTGTIYTIAGTGSLGFSGDGGPALSAKLYSPWNVAVDNKGNVYFSDEGNNRIRVLTPVPTSVSNIISNETDISLYPNPSKGQFTVSVKNLSSKTYLEIYNVLGEKVYATNLYSNTSPINLGNVTSGIYIYRVLTEKNNTLKQGKLLIE